MTCGIKMADVKVNIYEYAKRYGIRPATPRGGSISRLERSGAEVKKREFKLSTSYNKADAHHKEYSLSYSLRRLKVPSNRESGVNAAESRRTLTLSARDSRTPYECRQHKKTRKFFACLFGWRTIRSSNP